jgi:hypothetical protein
MIGFGECKPEIRLYIERLSSFSSFFKKNKGYFIKCCYLKQLGNFDRAVEHLAQGGEMHKRDQDDFYKG